MTRTTTTRRRVTRSRQALARQSFWACTLSLLVACQGETPGAMSGYSEASGGGPTAGGTTSGTATGGAPSSSTTDAAATTSGGPPVVAGAAGPLPLRRLNPREYANTVRDLLEIEAPLDPNPVNDDATFEFPRAGLVADLDARALQESAEQLVGLADVGRLLPCDPAQAGERECAAEFVETFGARAYRRPLVMGERERLLALYDQARDGLGLAFDAALGLLVEAMLQAPAFLYRWELGPNAASVDGSVVRLGSYEMASRLSYFILRSMPDEPLFASAAAGTLTDTAEIEAQARRLLELPRARESMAAFFEYWLGVHDIEDRNKNQEVYPEFTDTLKAAMRAEVAAFAGEVLFSGDATLSSLFLSTSTFANSELADIYEIGGVRGNQLVPVELDAATRSGLLTQPAFLAETGASNGSNPTRRGAFVFERILCQTLPDPPNDVPPPPEPSEGGTTRERFATHADNPCAASCHRQLDPLGYAFEHYDGIGRYREMDNGFAVDATGSIIVDGVTHEFDGALALAQVLADSREVHDCFATQWLRYALDRVEVDADQAALAGIQAAFDESGGSVRELVVAIATSPAFRERALAEGEVQP